MSCPYMGSKRRIAWNIYRAISQRESGKKEFIDLFCGGLAVAECFAKKGWMVKANDKNKYIIELLKKAIMGGFNDNIFNPEFITREKFFEILKNKDKYDNWLVGYIMSIWTFGNNQVDYLFGEEREPINRAGHELIINKNPELIKKLFPTFSQKYIDGILKQSNWHKRRMALVKVSRAKKEFFLFNQIIGLQRLEQLQQMEGLQRMELINKDYREIEISKEAIVYCDPPYQGTGEYVEGGFNHKEFWDYIRKIAETNHVYISEYRAPDDFKYIYSFKMRTTFNRGNSNNQPNEKLFIKQK